MFKKYLSKDLWLVQVLGGAALAAVICFNVIPGSIVENLGLVKPVTETQVAQVFASSVVTVTNDQELHNALLAVKGGETIKLAPGFYGKITIDVNPDYLIVGDIKKTNITPRPTTVVTITSADLNNRAIVKGLEILNAEKWRIENISFRPNPSPSAVYAITIKSNDVSFVRNDISYGDSTNWTATDWINNAAAAIQVDGTDAYKPKIEVAYNYIKNVNHGIIAGSNAFIHHNVVNSFRGDGMRANKNNVVIENNIITNVVKVDDNHADAFQSFTKLNDVVGAGYNANTILRNNTLVVSYDNPLNGSFQGIGMFDGYFVNWLFERNLVINYHSHGISVYGAINSVIKDNAGFSYYPDKNISLGLIRFFSHKNGTPTVGSTLQGNISGGALSSKGGVGVLSHTQIKLADYDAFFTDWRNGDFHLKSTAPLPFRVGADIDVKNLAPEPFAAGAPRLPFDAYGRELGPVDESVHNVNQTADYDRDGIVDVRDTCVIDVNPDQADKDRDGVGDVCDKLDGSIVVAPTTTPTTNPTPTPTTTPTTNPTPTPTTTPTTNPTPTPTTNPTTTPTTNPTPATTLTLTASPTTLTTGSSATLTWSSTNATSCTASGSWSGSKVISGSESTGTLNNAGTQTYTLSCTGTGGSVSKSVSVVVEATVIKNEIEEETISDVDKDGVPAVDDNCVSNFNPSQNDLDKDGVGDICDSIDNTLTPTAWSSAFTVGSKVITIERLNVRDKADGKLRGQQQVGATGVILNKTPVSIRGYTWIYVDFMSGSDGWVADSFVAPASTVVDVTTTRTATTITPGGEVVAIDRVRVRADGGLASTPLGKREMGDTGIVLYGPRSADQYQWWYVNFATGIDGWVADSFLSLSSSPAYTTTSVRSNSIKVSGNVITTDRVRVRADGSLSGLPLGKREMGDKGVIQYGPRNADQIQWWYVNFTEGQDGWVSGSYLQGL